MPPIPIANGVEYQHVLESVRTAVGLLQETRSIEFKESMDWNTFAPKFVKSCLSMANLQDGGLIIVGINGRDGQDPRSGITPEHLGTFDVDNCLSMLSRYAAPMVDILMCVAEIDGVLFLAIEVAGFSESPIICSRGHDVWQLKRGDIYYRPRGVPRTERIESEVDMSELIHAASLKQASRLVREAQEIGFVINENPDVEQAYENEAGDL